jgi:DNA polymerase-3 subunit alpha
MGGVIDELTLKVTRNGENMAFLRLEDVYGSLEVVIFPRIFEKCRYKLEDNKAIIVEGRAQISEKESKIIASDVYTMDEISKRVEAANSELWILFPDMDDFKNNSKNLNRILNGYSGFSNAFVQLKEEKMMKKLTARVNVESGVVDALKLEYGTDRVMVRKLN